MTHLQISSDLALPLDFATEGIVVIGVRGSGKSNTEVRFAEQLHENGIPFLAIDPKGDWYGIRMDGEKPGLPVPVFGGLYGDFPIDEHLGSRIADVLVDNNVSAVVDVSRMTHAARARFLTDLFKQLMERHQLEPHVRTVIFEEAHRYIPQQVSGPIAALKEAAAAVLLEGRSFGLGCWACTQRPARLHNDVLEEVDTAIIHRIGVTATADLKRVRDWVKHEDLGDEIGQSLTKLKAGEAWVLSPVSLGIVQRVQIARRTTFDSGATPVVGDAKTTRRRLATMADIDAPAIKEALAETIERAKADDPKELRKRIAELERHRCPEPAAVEPERVEVPIWTDADREFLTSAVVDLRHLREELGQGLTRAESMMAIAHDLAATMPGAAATPQTPVTGRPSGRPQPTPPAPRARTAVEPARPAATSTRERRPAGDGSSADLTPRQQQILDQLAWFEAVGLAPADRRQLAFFVGLSARTGNFQNLLSRLSTAGLIDYPKAGHVGLTSAGRSQATDSVTTPATSEALQAAILDKLTPRLRDVLRNLIAAYPDMLSREDIAAALGLSAHTGNFQNLLSKLRTLELIDYPEKGYVAATSLLFLNA